MNKIIQDLIDEMNQQINKLMPYAYQGDKSAIKMVKAYQARRDSLQMAKMELDGLGNTVMCNLLNSLKGSE